MIKNCYPELRKKAIVMGFLTSLFLNLVSCTTKITEESICNPTVSQMQLTRFMKLKIEKDTAIDKVVVKERLHLKVYYKNGDCKDAYLDNIWKGLNVNCEDRKKLVELHLNSIIDSESILKALSEKDQLLVMPVIRSIEMRNGMPKSDSDYVLCEELAGDVGAFWVINKPTGLVYLTKVKLDQIGLSIEQLKIISVQNIKSNIQEVKCEGGNGMFMITAGGNFETSLLYSDTLWTQLQSNVKGTIVIGIPNRDLLLVTGSEDHENLKKMTEIIIDSFNKGSYPISKKLFMRENGKWMLFEM
jgi:uncharacterized protein YtpQ (UPF0354 family)